MRSTCPPSLLLLVMGMIGCTDLPSSPSIAPPIASARLTRTATIGGREYLLFRTAEEARSQLAYAQIYSAIPSVWWSGNTAMGKSWMEYFGTDGEQRLVLKASNPRYANESEGTVTDAHFIPFRHSFTTPDLRTPLLGSENCGGIAELTGNYSAKVIIAVEIPRLFPQGISGVTTFRKVDSHQVGCMPNSCPAGTVQSPTDPNKCYSDRNESSGGGGSTDCVDCITDPIVTYCRVRYWYWKDTGEVFSSTILYCA